MNIEELIERDMTPVLEREVEVTIQGLLDLGGYIVSAMGWEPSGSYSEIGLVLARHGVLDWEEGELLAQLARLRSIVVHVYADLGYELLMEHARLLRSDARRLLSRLPGLHGGSRVGPLEGSPSRPLSGPGFWPADS